MFSHHLIQFKRLRERERARERERERERQTDLMVHFLLLSLI
jgi:hypothetical protein